MATYPDELLPPIELGLNDFITSARNFLDDNDPDSFVSLILADQMEENVSFEIGGPVYTAPSQSFTASDHELTKEELETLLPIPEPQRCYEW